MRDAMPATVQGLLDETPLNAGRSIGLSLFRRTKQLATLRISEEEMLAGEQGFEPR
jgi:hypothetical protein